MSSIFESPDLAPEEVAARLLVTPSALADLTLAELQAFSKLIESDVVHALTVDGSLSARNHIGGTAPTQVKAAISRARKRLA